MARLFRTLWIVTLVLLVPVIPFLLLGSSLDDLVHPWQTAEASASLTALAVVGILATDILLPIPSSVVSTLGGVRLGWPGGTAASWLGMTAGAVIGFVIARRWGRTVALWFTREDDLRHVQAAQARFGTLLLVIVRGVPVFAEASVLLAGLSGMSWRQFLVPVSISNLGIALVYSAFGDIAGRHQWLPAAAAIAIAIPVLLAAAAQRLLASRHQ